MHVATSALILGDLQNDFLHRDGAYGRAGQTSTAIAALPDRLAPLVRAARQNGILIAATLFTLVPGRSGEPIISPHLKSLRPFLKKGDFAPGAWGQQLVDKLCARRRLRREDRLLGLSHVSAGVGAAQMRRGAPLFLRHRN